MTGEEYFKSELSRAGVDISDRQAAQLAQVAHDALVSGLSADAYHKLSAGIIYATREMSNLRDTYKRLFPWYVRLWWRVVNKFDDFLDWFYGEP